MRKRFMVTVDIPENSSVKDVRAYLSAAANGWWGRLIPPGGRWAESDCDPLWNLPYVTVRPVKD